MSRTSGNRLTQVGSNSSLKPAATVSPLKVTWQLRSRSALENSQVPTAMTPLAASVITALCAKAGAQSTAARTDRKSTRLNSSHGYISYAVLCLNKQEHH